MKIVVASENPVKINAVESGFKSFYQEVQIEGIKTESGVSIQPLTESETLTGAHNRVVEA